MRHHRARAETSIEYFGNESDLSVGSKVLVALAQAAENGSSSGEGSNEFVISM